MLKTPLVAIAAAATLVTACGGSDDDTADNPEIVVEGSEPATDDTTGDTTGDTTDEEAAMAFADCMRENGVDEFPDPTVSADGSVDFGIGAGNGNSDPASIRDDSDFEAASDACADLLEGASFLPDEEDRAEMQDQMLEFADCLREQGLDVDDPDFDAGAEDDGRGGPGSLFGDSFDPDDPEAQAAIEKCRDIVDFTLGGE